MKQFRVYIMFSNSRVLYVGVTSNLKQRVLQHKAGESPGFTQKYKVAWFEDCPDADVAFVRETQIKSWSRVKKINLIEAMNPGWDDLSNMWSEPLGPVPSF